MKSSKKVIFVGSPLPNKMVDDHRMLSFNMADNIAQNVMIKGLYEHYGDDLTVISELSEKEPKDFHLDCGVLATPISSNGSNKVVYYMSLMVNYIRKLSSTLNDLNLSKSDDVVVITRGSYIFIAIPVMIARIRYGIKWIPFIITTVEVPEYGFPYSIISKLSRWTSKKADGVITYVAKTAKDYMPGKPFLEIIYSIESKLVKLYKEYKPDKPKKFTITYTGSFSSTYNFDCIIDVISRTGDKYHWVFAGDGPYVDSIKKLAASSEYEVDYLGLISNIEAIKLQKSSHLLLCLKGWDGTASNMYYTKYAASGKLIEYLCSGTPILAGDIPAFPSVVKPFMTCERDQTVNVVIQRIAEIESKYEAKVRAAKKGQQYAFKHFNADYQNKNVYEFLESL